MLLDEIADYLQAQGLGTVGTDIFKGFRPDPPDGPDNCISVYEYAGQPPEFAQDVLLDRPGLQVKVRNLDYSTGRALAQNIQNALHGLRNTVLSGTHYTLILANQSPEALGLDASGRLEWVQNFTVIKERN